MNKRQLIVAWVIICLLYSFNSFAQAYSKRDIQDLVYHFIKYDEKLKDHFEMHEDRLNELVSEVHKELQTYGTKEALKDFISSLFDKYIEIGLILERELENLEIQNGYYKPSQASPKFHNLNLEATYLELKMRLLGYIYEDMYKEPYLNE